MIQELTAQVLRENVHYNPATGLFTWLKSGSGRWMNRPAGSRIGQGYYEIKICGTRHASHRLAWLYTHGKWPDGCIDHINGVRDDNRIANLRDVTHQANVQNQRRPMSTNTSGFLGVCMDKRNRAKKYIAMIGAGGKARYIGHFHTGEEAAAAYIAAKRLLHEGCTI